VRRGGGPGMTTLRIVPRKHGGYCQLELPYQGCKQPKCCGCDRKVSCWSRSASSQPQGGSSYFGPWFVGAFDVRTRRGQHGREQHGALCWPGPGSVRICLGFAGEGLRARSGNRKTGAHLSDVVIAFGNFAQQTLETIGSCRTLSASREEYSEFTG
jgi:hypothetical protein